MERPVSAALALVRDGLAFADPPADEACAGALLRAEEEARQNHRGLWSDPELRPLAAGDPAHILRKRGEFVIVEGRVLSVGERPRRTYLNFGAIWNEDFTAFMDTDAGPLIAPPGMTPGELAGRRVRIRGYVLEDRGPAIAVARPGQLEMLDGR